MAPQQFRGGPQDSRDSRSRQADPYRGPVRDISKDPRLAKGAKVSKATKDAQDANSQKTSERPQAASSAPVPRSSMLPTAQSESSEDEEPLKMRQSLRKRMVIHSFTPSPLQSPRLSPPKSPEACMKTSPQSPKSPESHSFWNTALPLRETAPAVKPVAPANMLDTRSTQQQNVPKSPSKCYVPRSSVSGPSTEPTITVKTSTALADRLGQPPLTPISATQPTSSTRPPAASAAATSSGDLAATVSAAVPAASANLVSPSPLATHAAAAEITRVETSKSVPQAPTTLAAQTTAASATATITASSPLPPPPPESPSPIRVAAALAPTAAPTPVIGIVTEPSKQNVAPASMLPTPATPVSAVPAPLVPSPMVVPEPAPAFAPAPVATPAPAPVPTMEPPKPALTTEQPKAVMAEPGLLAPGSPPVPLRVFLSEGLMPGTRQTVQLGQGLQVPLSQATYVIVPSVATQRRLDGPIPPFAFVVDETWVLDSYIRGELQNVRDYTVDLAPSRKRKSSSLTPVDADPKPVRSRARRSAPQPRPEPEPEPEPEQEEADMSLDVDSDDSYCEESGDEADGGDGAAPSPDLSPSEADIANVWWLIDELRAWDKKGQIRLQLERCSREGISNARKLYYTYKAFVEKNVPDLRVRKPYTKRARVQ